ncbi:MAG: signal peptidase II [Deltaproteobacteria bacterium]|nr:signal peptidase II [Deltaproteobacteria bacterium]
MGLDLVTKRLAIDNLSFYEIKSVTSFFNLILVKNQGAAFSLLSGDGPGQGIKMIGLSVLAMVPLIWFYSQAKARDRGFLVSLGLVLGGAIGNICDRIRFGAVVDFLDFHFRDRHWPAFNVADIAICVGVGLLALSIVTGRGPFGHQAKNPTSGRRAGRARTSRSSE